MGRGNPAQTAYLSLTGKYLVRKDWMVGTTVLSETNDFNGCDIFGMIQNPAKTTENPWHCRTLRRLK
jgi:hypothetical protein